MKVQYDFSGSVVLVSGGASGIGAATARACEAAGAVVVVLDIQRGIDVSDSAAVKTFISKILEKHGRIDAAVLAAAIQKRTPIESISDEEWHRHMAVNLDGVFYCMREIAPVMRRQRKGAIVTFASGLVNMGWPGAGAYAASKGALIGLARCAAHELKPYGVRVNVLAPGLTNTPLFLDVASDEEKAMYEKSAGISSPDEVVPTVLYLISDASKNLTGTVVERRLVPK